MSRKGRPRKTLTAHDRERLKDDYLIENPTITVEYPGPSLQTEPTESSVTQDPEHLGLLPEQSIDDKRPSRVITPETSVEASPVAGIPRAFTREKTEEQTIIVGHNVEAPATPEYKPLEATPQKLVNEVTGRETLIAAAYSPPETKDGKKIIRG